MLKKILRELKSSYAMKAIFGTILLVFLFLVLMTHLCSCSGLSFVRSIIPDDSYAEEVLEEFIEDNTGMKIDITGASPED